jgi:ribosomal protein S18 acetylase RimI-like enzyme
VTVLSERVAGVLEAADAAILLLGDGPDGVAVLRFRASLWTEGLECHLAELYVAPALRGRGLGRTLAEAAIAEARGRGAGWIDVTTSHDDVAARGLYESLGFENRERPGGAVTYYYGRHL